MDRLSLKRYRKHQRRKRVRKKITGNVHIPRVSVYKSNRHFYLQAIDDRTGITIASASTYEVAHATVLQNAKSRADGVRSIGDRLANRLLKKGVIRVVYDCNGNRYHGNVKMIADSIRTAGVQV